MQNTKKKIINVNDNYVKTPPALSTYTEKIEESGNEILQPYQENIIVKEEQGGDGGASAVDNDPSFDTEGLVEKLSLETATDPKKHSMAEVVYSMMKRGGERGISLIVLISFWEANTPHLLVLYQMGFMAPTRGNLTRV